MELVLFLIAAGIIFYLYKTFQVYLSNPIIPNDKDTLHIQAKDVSQSIQVSPKDKLKATEYGIIVRILGKLSFADDKSCALEEKLISGIIHDMALESDKSEEEYLEIYRESANEDIEELANLFAAETIAQYKKRLKIIEFMFALSYADGNFTQEEEDMIISVAAILEIENDDFNKLYDEFKEINTNTITLTKDEAITLLGLSQNFTKKELDERYNQVVSEKRQNIFDPKNLTRSYNEFGGQDLRKYSQAYIVLITDLQTQNKEDKE